MFQIKISGVTTVSDALFAVEAGANGIGLCFDERNPRCIDAGLAGEIVETVRDKHDSAEVEIYAEFADAAAEDILWILRDANLYGPDQGVGIQLGGSEPPQLLAELQQHGLGPPQGLLHALGHAPIVPIVRTFSSHATPAEIDAFLDECERLKSLPDAIGVADRQRGKFHGLPIILGGELTPQNVAAAIAAAQPRAVSVTSGVELEPGKLDAARVWAFVAAAKAAFAAQATARTPPV